MPEGDSKGLSVQHFTVGAPYAQPQPWAWNPATRPAWEMGPNVQLEERWCWGRIVLVGGPWAPIQDHRGSDIARGGDREGQRVTALV